MNKLLPVLMMVCGLASGVALAAPGRVERMYEDNEIKMRLIVRTADQLRGFYTGRGFSRAAIDRILDTCVFAAIIDNKVHDVLWLELEQWRFDAGGKPVTRLDRDYWPARWDAVDLPQAHRSTFGWTLMPESRDLRLGEHVGGGVVLERQAGPFEVTARFRIGAQGEGGWKEVRFGGIECPQ